VENDLGVKQRAGGRLFRARGPATANHGFQWKSDELVVPQDWRLKLQVLRGSSSVTRTANIT